VIFGHDFLDDLLALKHGKNQVNHETGGMPSDFWAGVTDALNCASDDDATASTVILSEEDPHYEEVMQLDLNDYDLMTSAGSGEKKVQLVDENLEDHQKEHDS
jgi:hypothetical protein